MSQKKNILTITIMVNKGCIQIQGRLVKEWSSEEYPILVVMINNPDLLEKDLTKTLKNFIELISSSKTTVPESKENQTVNTQSPKANDRSPVKSAVASLRLTLFSSN
jgi:hypothetical protein